MKKFELVSKFKPAGDQPIAIKKLVENLRGKNSKQVLHGITGSGKTFTIANVIAELNRPTLVLVHNKTLAFQFYSELKELFPNNRVEYFVSYFDYYQPESFIPETSTYIEKDSRVNKHIELMRLKTTASLMTRSDVIVVSSISCLYGIGSPSDWLNLAFNVRVGQKIGREEFFKKLVALQYERNDIALEPGRFRVKGSTVDLILGYEKNIIRINFLGDKIIRMIELDVLNMSPISNIEKLMVFPARHYVVPEDRIDKAKISIMKELKAHAPTLPDLESQRLVQRTNYDLEMISEMGYCNGIENYSVHFENRKIEDPTFCLLDFFPKDFLFVIDESHQSLPQANAMYHGDRSRKKNLIEHGFRLPSAYGNRPLKFEEFEKFLNNVIYVSATPGEYEIKTADKVVQQFIRPTGLLDPEVFIRPAKGQVDDLIAEINKTIKKKERVLVTTLTKRMAEDLTEYLSKAGIKVRYLHSEIDSIERTEIIRQLRLGSFDVLIGINLLREGLDIPEVSLVAILDADKEGFLRDERSLIQTIGRAARNVNGKVVLYADKITGSIKTALDLTSKRREMQKEFNNKNGIIPKTIYKVIAESEVKIKTLKHLAKSDIPKYIAELESQMYVAADKLEFEKAIEIRKQIAELKKKIEIPQ